MMTRDPNRIAPVQRVKTTTYLQFRWPLSRVVPTQQPAFQILWREGGEMVTAFIPHDPTLFQGSESR